MPSQGQRFSDEQKSKTQLYAVYNYAHFKYKDINKVKVKNG